MSEKKSITVPEAKRNLRIVIVATVLAVVGVSIFILAGVLFFVFGLGDELTQGTREQGLSNPIPSTNPMALSLRNVHSITETQSIVEGTVGPAIYSSDSITMVVAIGSDIMLYDAASLQVAKTLQGHEEDVTALAVSAPSQGEMPMLLASSAVDEESIVVWNLQTGEQVWHLEGHVGWIRDIAFSPDGSMLASGGVDRTVRLWDMQHGTLLHTLEAHTNLVNGVVFSPDGMHLASSSRDGTVRMWSMDGRQVADTTELKTLFEVSLNPETTIPYLLTGISFSPDSSLLAVGATDNNVYVLRVSDGSLVQKLEGHADWVIMYGVAFSPDGRMVASASLDGTVRVWNPVTGALINTLDHSKAQIRSISWHADGVHLATSSNTSGEVLVWDVHSAEIEQQVPLAQGPIIALDYSKDSRMLGTSGVNGVVKVHTFEEGKQITLSGGNDTIQPIAFASETNLVVATRSVPGRAILFDLTRIEQPIAMDVNGSALSVAVSPDYRVVATGNSRSEIALWDSDVTPGQHLGTLTGLQGGISDIVFSSDGKRLVASNNFEEVFARDTRPAIGIWDIGRNKLQHTFIGHKERITGIALQPHGPLLASASKDGTLRLWNVVHGEQVADMHADELQGWFTSTSFSPDGTLLAAGTADGTILFWDAVTGDSIHRLETRKRTILALAFSPNGEKLATSFYGGGVSIFEIQDTR